MHDAIARVFVPYLQCFFFICVCLEGRGDCFIMQWLNFQTKSDLHLSIHVINELNDMQHNPMSVKKKRELSLHKA